MFSRVCSLNFQPGKYTDKNNQMRKMYDITRDGFTFLAMGFIGRMPQFCGDLIRKM
jgi:Rha family phage regulatory protein